MEPLVIGNKIAKLPIIQGGMGIGVSRGKLAGAVAYEGGIGVISSAQIGFDKPDFEKNIAKCNQEALAEHIKLAKDIAKGNGLIGVNIMVALNGYEESVKTSAEAGADVIISGAGLPMDLPKFVEGYDIKIAPLVSSERCARLIIRRWERTYNRYPDFIVIEGPKAGGHLGFTHEEALNYDNYENEIRAIIATAREYEKAAKRSIPVVVAGGIFTASDVAHALAIGASGVQVASRFVATKECDAADAYKQAFVDATREMIKITKSPVGMPGRALNNAFLKKAEAGEICVDKCYSCLKKCNPKEIPYCITKALVNAVTGDVDNGLIFCGDNVDRIHEITTVHELMMELVSEISYSVAV